MYHLAKKMRKQYELGINKSVDESRIYKELRNEYSDKQSTIWNLNFKKSMGIYAPS